MIRRALKTRAWTTTRTRTTKSTFRPYAWRLARSPRAFLLGVSKWTYNPIRQRCNSFSTTYSVTRPKGGSNSPGSMPAKAEIGDGIGRDHLLEARSHDFDSQGLGGNAVTLSLCEKRASKIASRSIM